jgi:hypothetical protein
MEKDEVNRILQKGDSFLEISLLSPFGYSKTEHWNLEHSQYILPSPIILCAHSWNEPQKRHFSQPCQCVSQKSFHHQSSCVSILGTSPKRDIFPNLVKVCPSLERVPKEKRIRFFARLCDQRRKRKGKHVGCLLAISLVSFLSEVFYKIW